ncbi:hypothetical protein F511_05407 [Dorcoceras hygrometricum]|uniref:Uncharacterized protein n=1 Tax=Dorcoceras hygrometricum TaxID=472368 RepID=A0A2Z7BFT8_9LAMI|nr:hypothetical protein F511_05407 [Dorcoceras hygrometricum]
MDRIGDIYRNLPRRADVIVTTVGARHKCQQDMPPRRTTNRQTEQGSTIDCVLNAAGSRRASTRDNEKAPRVGYYTRNQQREFITHLLVYVPMRIPYAPAGLLMYRLVVDDVDPIPQPAAVRTPRLLKCTTAATVAKAKRCRINLCKRHRFAIAISKNYLLVNSSLRLDFLLYDVASLLRLDVQATCWYLATAGLKPSADYDDITDDIINGKPSANSLARRRFISFTSLLIC